MTIDNKRNQRSNRLILSDLMFENTPVIGQHSICIGCRKCYSYWLDQYNKEEKLEKELFLMTLQKEGSQ